MNKGDTLCPHYRSRLVAREFNTSDNPEWYAATPPSEALRIILSKLAADRKSKLMYADVSRAYFYAPAVRPVYVKIAAEDMNPGDEGIRVLKCSYLCFFSSKMTYIPYKKMEARVVNDHVF